MCFIHSSVTALSLKSKCWTDACHERKLKESHKAMLVSSLKKNNNSKAAMIFINHRAPCSDAKVERLALETAGQTCLSLSLTAP